MRVLILSANTGEGHNSAARAIQRAFEAHGDRCEIANGLIYLGRATEAVICRGHVLCYRRLPKLFGLGYQTAERIARRQDFQERLDVKARRRQRAPLRALAEKLNSGEYDAVICTHVFTAQLVSRLRRAGKVRLPCFFVATDYTSSPGTNQLDVDAWLIPHAALIPEFAEYGIPEEKLIPTGIPVGERFLRRGSRAEARRALGLPEDKPIVVLSCGSMGGGPMGRMVLSILEKLPKGALLVAICGSNHALETALRKLLHTQRLMVLGFVERMDEYMDAADLFLTKPGGLSVSEAAHKHVPLLLYNAVPGCESRNMDFFVSLGCAAAFHDPFSFAGRVSSMLHSPEALRSLEARCAREFSGDPAERIRETVCDFVQ